MGGITAGEMFLGGAAVSGGKKAGQQQAQSDPQNQQELMITAVSGISLSSFFSLCMSSICGVFVAIMMMQMKNKQHSL
jgi:hypothetical protein